ncbi:T-box transcription factor TBX22, partial [Ophiophagus hannah]
MGNANSTKRKLKELEEELSSSDTRTEKTAFRRSQAPEKKTKGEITLSLCEEAREETGTIQVDLQGSELWKRFHEIGTEMIITKAGRRMFPSVRVKVKGLDPVKQYYIAIDVVPVDSKRYRYVYHSSQWMVAGNTDHSCITPRLYIHPDSPCSGETWMRQIISFDRVKLTNNEMDDKGHIILQSMHKYKPRVHIIIQDSRFDLSQTPSLPAAGVQTFSFKETEFTTVTAYQNQQFFLCCLSAKHPQITKLKIDRNPFAKGFRDPGRNRIFSFNASGGIPSPLSSLLSPAGSPPTFHLSATNLGMPCPDSYLHHLGLPICYKICPTNILRQPSLVFPSHHKLGSATGAHFFPHFMVEVPTLSSLSIGNVRSGKAEDLDGVASQGPSSGGQMLYGLHASGNIFPSAPVARETLNCALHPPYGFYGYNFSVPSRLMNSLSHFKVSDGMPPLLHDSRVKEGKISLSTHVQKLKRM